jgi:hypothetical protein
MLSSSLYACVTMLTVFNRCLTGRDIDLDAVVVPGVIRAGSLRYGKGAEAGRIPSYTSETRGLVRSGAALPEGDLAVAEEAREDGDGHHDRVGDVGRRFDAGDGVAMPHEHHGREDVLKELDQQGKDDQ